MFETHDQGRLFPVDLGGGNHSWAYVLQTTTHEWFYVTHEYLDSEDSSETTKQQFMIPMAPYLLGLTSCDSPTAFVSEIQLVSPPSMNKQGRWLMEPLKRIRGGGGRFCYELENGQIYPREEGVQAVAGEILWEVSGGGHE